MGPDLSGNSSLETIYPYINQSFYFRNKPISEIDRKTGETEETTKTTKTDKNIVHTIRIESKVSHTNTNYI